MNDVERAEAFFKNLEGLGYVKKRIGYWVTHVVDDGQGFPKTVYECPFCKAVSDQPTNFCCDCGASLVVEDE